MQKPVSWFVLLLLVAVPLVGGIAAVAYAADLCLTVGSIAEVVLQDVGGGKDGKNMNKDLAKPNKCMQLSGFVPAGGWFSGMFGTMSLCTDSTATHVTVIGNFLGGSIQTEFPLPIPTAEGSSDIRSDFGDAFGVQTTAAVCVPASVPVP